MDIININITIKRIWIYWDVKLHKAIHFILIHVYIFTHIYTYLVNIIYTYLHIFTHIYTYLHMYSIVNYIQTYWNSLRYIELLF